MDIALVKTDALQLCLEVAKGKKSFCKIAMETGTSVEEADYLYQQTETPFFLQKQRILQILKVPTLTESVMHTLQFGKGKKWLTDEGVKLPKGFYQVNFDIEKARAWCQKELQNRLSEDVLEIVSVPDGWCWLDKKKGIYQFGKLGEYEQRGGIRKKVFRNFIELFEKAPNGVSVKTLSERIGIKPERVRIEINAISSRLFNKKGVSLRGSRKGFYTIEVNPQKHPDS